LAAGFVVATVVVTVTVFVMPGEADTGVPVKVIVAVMTASTLVAVAVTVGVNVPEASGDVTVISMVFVIVPGETTIPGVPVRTEDGARARARAVAVAGLAGRRVSIGTLQELMERVARKAAMSRHGTAIRTCLSIIGMPPSLTSGGVNRW
jgi:hypothetical protein